MSMRFPFSSIFFLLFLIAGQRLAGQVVLLEEQFTSCDLPLGWSVESSGNPDFVWYVDLAQNPLILGQSINSSCMLFVDDHALSADTLGYAVSFISPEFDVTPFTKVECTMDVFFRFGQTDFIQIIATDGVTESELARFDQYRTNELNITDGHFTLRHDLALVSQTPNTRIIIRYTSPDNSIGKFAAIDNIRIVGSGGGVNVLREAFNSCEQTAGWETQIVSGDHDWRFGKVELGSSAFYDGNSMNGSCFVLIDDSESGEFAPPSTVRLLSPWFSGNAFLEYELNFDFIMPYSGAEYARVYLQTSPTDSVLLFQSEGKVGGPFFPDYVSLTCDLSSYRAALWRLVFEFSDGGLWGYWAGVDNVKVTGVGPANEFCVDAISLNTGDTCISANNRTAVFDGPAATCTDQAVGSLWYLWESDVSGIAVVTVQSGFNSVVDIFSGACGNLQLVTCNNRDEHGFYGENTYFEAVMGAVYRIRVSGQNSGFGLPTGNLCIGIATAAGYPSAPANDTCTLSALLQSNVPCSLSNNLNAGAALPAPTLNELARADAWYHFTAASLPAGAHYSVRSNATFSDIITAYQGSCANLQEVGSNQLGSELDLHDLVPGQTYRLRISGNFATVEGELCPQLLTVNRQQPGNDTCDFAVLVQINGPCVAGNNTGAEKSENRPDCVVLADHDIWFKFIAPVSGAVHIRTGADFRHVLALWQGSCDSLSPIFCTPNPEQCAGYVTVGSLLPGKTYYVQIASWIGMAGRNVGSVCVRILDGSAPPDFQPLQLAVATLCTGPDSARLEALATGGAPPYMYAGYTSDTILGVGQPYLIVVKDANGCEQYQAGVVSGCEEIPCTTSTRIAAKMLLQGPYIANTQLMHDSLRVKNLIPLTEPYTGLTNFMHTGGGGGEETTADVLAVAGPNAIVDWVFLELRDPAAAAEVAATRAALLQRDGDVVDVDGISPVEFQALSGRYYSVAVRHRNHLGAQWGVPLFFPDCEAVAANFTALSASGFYAYNNLNPAQRLIVNRNALWAGNGRVDYQLKYNGSTNDRTILLSLLGLTTPNTIATGYQLADYNLDGFVKYNGSANDRNVLLGNVGITSPLGILHDQTAR